MLTFIPFSSTVGALMVPPDSDIASLADLKGKKIGVAGGPLDKSWLLLQGLAAKRHGMDLAAEVEPVYGAPPLLNEKVQTGELDAVLNYWHFAARLDAKGYEELVGVEEAIGELGVDERAAAARLRVLRVVRRAEPGADRGVRRRLARGQGAAQGRRGVGAHPAAHQGRGRRHLRGAQAPLPRGHHRALGRGRSAPMPPRCTRSWPSSAASSWSAAATELAPGTFWPDVAY